MENQGQTKQISRAGLIFVFICILSGWLLDVFSSFVGARMGGVELLPYFTIFPATWLLLMSALTVFVYKMKAAPFWIRGWIFLFIVFFSFAPSIRNTLLILEVVF